jgi:alpha-N-arabinofuranosidase
MKAVDPSIELVVCGSCGPLLPTYMEWDRTVLDYVADLADYVSLHRYVDNRADDTLDFLAVTKSIDRQIEEIDAVCRFVKAKQRAWKRPYLCFDEWNVWYKTYNAEGLNPGGEHPRPLIEEIYNLEDALVVAGFLNSFIRHADSVKIANIAQIVNVIAPILTRGDELLIQSIYYVFEMFSKRRGGVALRTSVEGPTYSGRVNGEVHYVDSSAIVDGDELKVFVTNRNPEEQSPLVIEIADLTIARLVSAELLTGPDAKAANSFESPEVVRSVVFEDAEIKGGRARVRLPPLSVVAMTLKLG